MHHRTLKALLATVKLVIECGKILMTSPVFNVQSEIRENKILPDWEKNRQIDHTKLHISSRSPFFCLDMRLLLLYF